MKQNNLKTAISFLLLFQILIISVCQDSPDTHTRTIYDFYSDEHEVGKWQGYSFFLSPDMSADGEISKKMLVLNETGLYIEDTIYFKPISFNFLCDFEENLPCSVVKFQKMFSSNYDSFVHNMNLFINKTNIQDQGDQCMVLHISADKVLLVPYLICLYVTGQGANLKSAVLFFLY